MAVVIAADAATERSSDGCLTEGVSRAFVPRILQRLERPKWMASFVGSSIVIGRIARRLKRSTNRNDRTPTGVGAQVALISKCRLSRSHRRQRFRRYLIGSPHDRLAGFANCFD